MEMQTRSCLAVCFSLLLVSSISRADTTGRCRFDSTTLAFAGTAKAQAECLLRPVAKWGHVSSDAASLPATLDGLIGKPVDITRDVVKAKLVSLGLTETAVGGSLGDSISQGQGGSPNAPQARYFVIHDTSAPWYPKEFPSDIDTSESVNTLDHYAGTNAVAHIFINRRGELLIGHPLSVPWRATKLENQIGIPAKGMFIHIESIQPRCRDPQGSQKNDAIAPAPGFTQRQYENLALLYLVASFRAGRWMVPAFHAAIDEGISDAHDDPQNFDLSTFDASLAKLITSLPKQAH